MGVVLEDSETFLVSIIKQIVIYELSVLTGTYNLYLYELMSSET